MNNSQECIVCIVPTAVGTIQLDGQYELTESQEKLIADTCEQIESLVPDLKEHIKQEQEAYEKFEQTM